MVSEPLPLLFRECVCVLVDRWITCFHCFDSSTSLKWSHALIWTPLDILNKVITAQCRRDKHRRIHQLHPSLVFVIFSVWMHASGMLTFWESVHNRRMFALWTVCLKSVDQPVPLEINWPGNAHRQSVWRNTKRATCTVLSLVWDPSTGIYI